MTAAAEYAATIISAAVHDVDRVAVEMETKWGVGRLPMLVPGELAEKFRSQQAKFSRAVWAHDPDATRTHGPAMIRAWQALDKAATAAGEQPISPDVWEIVTPSGEVIALTRTSAEAAAVTRANRAMRCFSAEEIGRLIEAFPEIVAAKAEWPGATVTAARVKAPGFDEANGDSLDGF